MSDTVDLTILSNQMLGLERDMRLIRLQVDQMAGTVPARLSAIEQTFHDLVGEVARGFGQQQQQIARLEKRIDAVDAGLTALRGELAESTEQIIRALTNAR